MHNMVKFYMMGLVSGIETAKSEFDNCIDGAQKAVADWAGIKDWTSLGDSASKPPSGNASDPTKHQTSGSHMMAGHFRNQGDKITIPNGMPQVSLVQKLVDDMLKAIFARISVY